MVLDADASDKDLSTKTSDIIEASLADKNLLLMSLELAALSPNTIHTSSATANLHVWAAAVVARLSDAHVDIAVT